MYLAILILAAAVAAGWLLFRPEARQRWAVNRRIASALKKDIPKKAVRLAESGYRLGGKLRAAGLSCERKRSKSDTDASGVETYYDVVEVWAVKESSESNRALLFRSATVQYVNEGSRFLNTVTAYKPGPWEEALDRLCKELDRLDRDALHNSKTDKKRSEREDFGLDG